MDDAFSKAKSIRSGEGELPAFEELTGWIQRVPDTWLPSLLLRVATLCFARGVFAGDGINAYIEVARQNGTNASESSLRNNQPDQ